ncbi:MAG: ribosome small subunit-dependent GTPase A [Bacteroidota bacterium]|nr:ribosome small subunit-dependent GTPase A [Bacteroidota bacterium]
MKGKVYKSTGSWYTVKSEEGGWYQARIKGKFKIDQITSTNPIAVGDQVTLETEEDAAHSWVITQIEPRRNYVTRQSPHNKFQHHIIASNIDQSLLFATLKDPRTSQGFIDRFLVACEAYHIPAVIVFNKADLYRKKEMEKLEEIRAIYQDIGYGVLVMSLQTQQGVEEVGACLKDKITLLSGHSGVGKSTFINTVFPEILLKTREVSDWSGKGMHTTTFAEMFDLPGGGSIIDTPGLREFALVDMERTELSHYFPEMRELISKCRFNNCLHVEEPGCAVKEAVELGKVAADRYVSYLNILGSLDTRKW